MTLFQFIINHKDIQNSITNLVNYLVKYLAISFTTCPYDYKYCKELFSYSYVLTP